MEDIKKISEEDLEKVAGGEDTESNEKCYFKPEYPYNYRYAHGTYILKCKANCFNGIIPCRCYGKVQCRDKEHIIDQDADIKTKWYPYPKDLFGHICKDIEPLTPDSCL